MPEDLSSRGPQFQTAEYAGEPSVDRCHTCGTAISSTYYRLNGGMACVSCAEKARYSQPRDSGGGFMRALLFGSGGAVLGLILYSAVGIITGWMIGYVSLAVGFIVGKAMMKGSGGIGGRRYQVAAAILTYAAVSMSAIPIAISQFAELQKNATQVTKSQPAQQPAETATPSGAGSQPQDAQPAATSEEAPAEGSLGLALGMLALLGLASPFLALESPFHGAIGLLILFIGIQIAWKMTAGKTDEILGPFRAGASGDTPA